MVLLQQNWLSLRIDNLHEFAFAWDSLVHHSVISKIIFKDLTCIHSSALLYTSLFVHSCFSSLNSTMYTLILASLYSGVCCSLNHMDRVMVYVHTYMRSSRSQVCISNYFFLGHAGLMATYHAKNEYCLFSDMCQGYRVFASIISQLEGWNHAIMDMLRRLPSLHYQKLPLQFQVRIRVWINKWIIHLMVLLLGLALHKIVQLIKLCGGFVYISYLIT